MSRALGRALSRITTALAGGLTYNAAPTAWPESNPLVWGVTAWGSPQTYSGTGLPLQWGRGRWGDRYCWTDAEDTRPRWGQNFFWRRSRWS